MLKIAAKIDAKSEEAEWVLNMGLENRKSEGTKGEERKEKRMRLYGEQLKKKKVWGLRC